MKIWPRYTILRRKVVWDNREVVGKKGYGEFIKRQAGALNNVWTCMRRTAPTAADLVSFMAFVKLKDPSLYSSEVENRTANDSSDCYAH